MCSNLNGMKNLLYLLLFSVLSLCFACSKCCVEPNMEQSFIIDGPWQLISATAYGTQGSVSRYVGTAADSVIFGFTTSADGSVNYTSLISFIGNRKVEYAYGLTESSIQCTPAWKSGYSDQMKILYCTPAFLVFSMDKNNRTSSAEIEIDSLKKIRSWKR